MIIHDNKVTEIKNAVVTIGSFDGVHYGHLAIINALNKKAKSIDGESVVITFSPHPRIALNLDAGNLFFLNSMEEKISLLEAAGVDHLIILPFNKEISTQTMEEFFVNYIKNTLNSKAMVVGYNHRFGSDKSSDYETLLNLGERENIDITRVAKQGLDRRDISSTTIRNLIKIGNIYSANLYLTHPYLFVSSINNNGELLYNQEKKLYPLAGEYNVIVETKDEKFEATANIDMNRRIVILGVDKYIEGAKIYFVSKVIA